MDKLYSLEVLCKCTPDQVQALNDAINKAAVEIGLEVVIIIPEVADDNQD